MPFQSEKQRRYLWAEHPEIAKRWAKKYPQSNKGLPMYAADKDNKTKESSATPATPCFQALSAPVPADRTNLINSILGENHGENSKTADSKQERVTLPRSEAPVYAGQERAEGKMQQELPDGPNVNDAQPETTINSLLHKISVVLSPALAQELERRKSLVEGRDPQFQPKNVNLKHYPSSAGIVTPPPMGLTPPPQPQAPAPQQPPPAQQPQAAQPANTGMNSPSARPIQSFGPLSMTGNINGNAAFGAKNSPDSMKISAAIEKWAAGNPTLAWLSSMEFPIYPEPEDFAVLDDESDGLRGKAAKAQTPCSCGCGDTVKTCKCSADCSCRKPGGSCYKAEKTAAKQLGLWDRIRAKKQRGEKPAQPGDKDYPDAKSWKKVTRISEKQSGTPAWQRSEGKNSEGGLNEKGRKSYEREHGGNLKAPVTEKNPKGKAKKRQNSFCARMCGMKRVNTGAKTKSDPDSRINKSLRKWNCKCGSAYEFGQKVAQDFDPAMSRDAENALMHGAGLVGSGVLGTVAGLPVSAGLEQFAKARNWIPSDEKNPLGYNLANSLLKIPMFLGGTLGLGLYDNYILRPHTKREHERKQQEEAVRQQLAQQAPVKQAEASLERVLSTALVSAAGGLALGGYPGKYLQEKFDASGYPATAGYIASKVPLALGGALSSGLYNYWRDKNDVGTKARRSKQQPATPSLWRNMLRSIH
jgi:hypothetical protein